MVNKKDFPIVLISLFGNNIGVRYISSFLKAKGYPTYLVQFNQLRYRPELYYNDYFTGFPWKHRICLPEDLSLLIAFISRIKPKLIGISVTSVVFQTAKIITLEIKKHTNVIIAWGGIHAIIVPEECIQYADVVCLGEGEIPIWELAEKIRKEELISNIKSLWIKEDNRIEKNEIRPLITDLDALPFPDIVEDGNKFLIDSGRVVKDPPIISAYIKYTYPISSTRGCMFNCSYCCHSVIRERYEGKGDYLRRRSVNNVIDELRLAIMSKPIVSIQFWDSIFTYDKDWIDEFCSKYVSEIGKPFFCYAHPHYISREIILKLAKSGLTTVIIGIQSASESISKDVLNRKQSNQDILNFDKTLKDLGITTRYDLISDNPYERDRDQDETVELLLKLKHPFRVAIYSLCYFPETPLTKQALNDRLITVKDLEQNSSKALNNFFMCLPLSRDKKNFFWNCIKSMAINRYFPKTLTRFCKKNIFFRKHPGVLFFICRSYLFLLKYFKKEYRYFPFSLVDRVPMDRIVVIGEGNVLFNDVKIAFSFFPLHTSSTSKKLCLRIKNKFVHNLFMHIFIEMVPFLGTDLSNESTWTMDIELDKNSEHNVYFELNYPLLLASFNNKIIRLRLLKKGKLKYQKGKLYVMKVKYRFHGRAHIGGRVLCCIQN